MDYFETDQIALRTIAERLAAHRLETNLSQAHLAMRAGISPRTLQRLEAGEPVAAISLLRVLRALSLIDNLDELVPEPLPSPIERLKTNKKRRKRARG